MTNPEMAASVGKTFDAVELTRQLRFEVHRETEHLSRTEFKEYLRARVKMPRDVSENNAYRRGTRGEDIFSLHGMATP